MCLNNAVNAGQILIAPCISNENVIVFLKRNVVRYSLCRNTQLGIAFNVKSES